MVSNVAGLTYTWNLSGGGSISGSGSKISIAWTTPGKYTLSVSPASNGCTGTSLTLEIVVKDVPGKPVITANAGILSSSSSTGNQWLLNGSPVEGATRQTYEATVAGNYTVQVSNVCGKSEMSEIYALQATGLAEELEKLIKIYPNPADKFVTVELPDGLQGQSIRMYNAKGAEVRYMAFLRLQKVVVDVQTLSKGTYTIRIETAKGTLAKKIVIQ
jgi:hypothetical protein